MILALEPAPQSIGGNGQKTLALGMVPLSTVVDEQKAHALGEAAHVTFFDLADV